MSFTPTPIIGGDAFEQACAIGLEAGRELALSADPAATLRKYWDEIVAQGWLEAEGELADLAALAGGAGRGGLPLPVALSCGVIPFLLAGRRDLLKHRIALILPEAAVDDPADAPRLEGGRLTGAVAGIETPPDPTHALVVLDDALLLAPVDGLTRYQRIDAKPAADFRFNATPVEVLERGVAQRVEQARDLGALLTCIEAVSAAGAVIEQTIAYLLNRVQFGVPLATHQALRHRVAEMYVEYENLRGLAAQALRTGGEDWRDIAFAKLRLGEAGRFIAQAAIQCHGGMGMTEDVAAIRLARRIMMAEFEFGDRSFQARRLLDAHRAAA